MKKKFTFLMAACFMLLAILAIPMKGWADETDVLNKSDFTASGTNYSNFSNVQKHTAVYAGRSSVQNNSVGMRRDNTNGAGIFTTTSGGVAKSLTFTWTSTTSRTLQVYGKNSAYSLNDTKDINKYGTLITSVTYNSGNTTPTLTLDNNDEYEYILIIPSSTSMLSISDITIVWTTSGGGASTYSLTYSANGGTGNDFVDNNGGSGYDNGASVTIKANTGEGNPNFTKTGYTWSGWTRSIGNTPKTYQANDTLIIKANTTVNAVWNINSHNITMPSNDTYGSYSASETNPVPYGTTVTLTYTPASGYSNYSANWSVNGTPIDGNTFSMPDENVTVTVSVTNRKTDVLNRAFTGVTATSYTSWNNKSGSASDAVYAGNSAGGNSSIQLRSSDNSGIVSTTSGGKVKKVVVTWNSSTAADRTLDVYGKNSAYTASSQLYGTSSEQGTKLGSIVNGTSTELTVSGNYKYIGLRSNSGAMYLSEIDITWEPSNDPTINADNVDIAYTATTECLIMYEIGNYVAGNMVATTEADWISNFSYDQVDEIGEVGFHASQNPNAVERTATVTLTYTYNITETVTKNVTITQAGDPNAPGTQNNPYTVAQAIENTPASGTSANVYIHGIVSAFWNNNATILVDSYHRYYISDDGGTTTQLLVFNGNGLNNEPFSYSDDLLIGDEVTILGGLTIYNNTKEIAANNYLVSKIRRPVITAENVDLAYNETSGAIAYTVNNPDNGTVSATITAGENWIKTVTVTDPTAAQNTVTFTTLANTVGQREGTIRLTYTYGAKATVTRDVTITQAPAKLTITFRGNGGTFETDDEYTQMVDYGSPTDLDANKFEYPGFSFNNWNTEAAGSGDPYNNEAEVTLTSDLELYAQWTTIPTYTLVTDVDDIVPGAHYVISCVKKDVLSNKVVMGSYNSDGGYRNYVSINTDDYLDENTITYFSGLCEFVISGFTDNWTIYDGTNYLKYGSNKLYNNATVADDTKWKISIAGTSIATITAASETSYSIQYNSGSPRFACYSSNQQKVYLYKKDNDNNIHPYSSSEYSSEVTIKDDITLSSDYTLTVADGGVLTLTGSVSCSNASWLVVEDGGQLIIPSAKADVKATFQKEITAYTQATGKDTYYLIANPTTGSINPTTVSGMLDNNYDLYYFDEAQSGAEWRNYKQEVFNLVNGKGYLYANSSDHTLEFPGTVPTGTTANITLSKSESGTYNGFNLVGNPLSNNVTSMKIGESSCSYYKVNSSTGVFAVSTDPIIVGEAFMVEAPSNGATLRLNPSAKDEDGFTNEVIRLEVSNSKFTDVAYVYFGNHLPLTKINHLNDEAPMLYIHNENSDKAVEVYNNRGEVKSVDVNFEAKTTGTYNISAKMMKGEVKYMHLYDRLTGIDTDLLMDDYSFIGAKGDITGRFILNLESVDNNSSTGSDTFAYQSGNDIIVNGEGTLEVYDVTGRKVMATTINGVETINGLNSGVYIFRIIGETLRTQKIVVR